MKFDNTKSGAINVRQAKTPAKINKYPSNAEYNQNAQTLLKKAIYNYGGFIVNIRFPGVFKNTLNTNDYLTYDVTGNGIGHALHVIGWNDHYKYSFCHYEYEGLFVVNTSGSINTETGELECRKFEPIEGVTPVLSKITGEGAWILKNSWGENENYVYLTYDSVIEEALAISKYSDIDYDNSVVIRRLINNSDSKYYLENIFEEEKVTKIKIGSSEPTNIDLYFSENGDLGNLTLFGNYNFDSGSYKTIDLSNENVRVNKDSVFVINTNEYSIDISLFTNSSTNSQKAYSNDFNYSLDDTLTNDSITEVSPNDFDPQ